ncbi:MAG: hypothetical protein OES47_13525 [Acidobacteriota bacterium]|nr:hypothetical protein [Acidobacteriota bacterium]
MKKFFAFLFLVSFVALPVAAQRTAPPLAGAYDALADTILAVRKTEAGLVRSILDYHYRRAEKDMKQGNWQDAAAEMALFANEGDNSIAGVRKRLLEGGHHFNAAGEEQGIFEDGYVIVRRKAKKRILDISAALQKAGADAEREQAWKDFSAIAQGLLGNK